MKKTKTLFILLICIAMLLASCSNEPEAPATTAKGVGVQEDDVEMNVLKLPFSANDSLNPYSALSEVNSQLDALLYQPLYKIDSSYNPVPVLAATGKIVGKIINITLADASFSDGSKITGEDVVYSYLKARDSKAYASLVSSIQYAEAKSDTSVVFEMTGNNDYALSLLTFPIVKNGTADSKKETPVGSGPFVTSENDAFVTLVKSPVNQNAKIEKIQLVDISKAVNEAYVLQTGDISFCFDSLQDGSYTKINAVTRSVLLNNMVYIGFNAKRSAFSDANVRAAVASAVDIDTIVQNAFRGNAVATRLPFNPNWSKAKDITASLNSASALSLLEKSGYNKLSYSGVRSDGKTVLDLDLLVNEENTFRVTAAKLIAEALNDLGFKVTVKKEKYEDFVKDISSSNYDMYIGEVKLTEDMNLNAFFSKGGSCSSGIDLSSEIAEAYSEVLNGNMNIETFSSAFMREIPFAPLCFRTGVCASLRGVNLNVETTKWYSDFESWSY